MYFYNRLSGLQVYRSSGSTIQLNQSIEVKTGYALISQ